MLCTVQLYGLKFTHKRVKGNTKQVNYIIQAVHYFITGVF